MSKNKGFTLVELLVTILFIAILAFLSLTYSLQSNNRTRLKSTARDIAGEIYKIKARAAKENITIRITFGSNAYSYAYWDTMGSIWRDLSDITSNNKYYDGGTTEENVSINNPPVFAINSRGFVVKPDAPNQFILMGQQTIELQAPGNRGTDRIILDITPIGGINVKREFR